MCVCFLTSEVASIVKHQIIKHKSNTTYSCLNWLLEQFPPSSSDVCGATLKWSFMPLTCTVNGWVMSYKCHLTFPTPKTPKPQLVAHVLLLLVPNKWEFSHGPSWNLICSSASATHADPTRCLIKSERQYTAIAVEKQRLTNNHESSCDTSQGHARTDHYPAPLFSEAFGATNPNGNCLLLV